MPVSRTMGGLLEEMAQRYPDRPALVFEGTTFSYHELNERANALAKGMLRLGIGRGDKVALLASNRPEWLFVCFAALRIGAVLCPLNTWYKRAELDYALGHCEARLLLTMDHFLRQDFAADFEALMPELGVARDGRLHAARYPSLEGVVFLGQRGLPGAMGIAGLEALGREVSDAALAAAIAKVRPDDLCYILYTSGSTAAPKGVMLQHYGIVENPFRMAEAQRITPEDRMWIAVPMFWATGSVNLMPSAFTHGACVVLQEYFETGHALELFERERCTGYFGFGNMTISLVEHPDFPRRDLSALKKGSAGLTPEDKRLAIEELGVSLTCSPYGLTESYGYCCCTEAGDPLDVVLYTQGHPLPGWEFKIVHPETGQPLPQGEVGLVCIKGYTTIGYFKNEEETAKAFDGDGFFITGDLGMIDADGRFRFHSRLKEMIKTGGINVSPLEVEQILQTNPKIRQAHVVGIPDPVRGEAIVAFVEPAGEPLAEDEVRDFVKERAANYKVPHRVLFRADAQLPRTATGKVPKFRLREEAEKELAARTAG